MQNNKRLKNMTRSKVDHATLLHVSYIILQPYFYSVSVTGQFDTIIYKLHGETVKTYLSPKRKIKTSTEVQLFKAFRITGSSRSVDGICLKIIKQSTGRVHV